jgi:hypothetical protein
MATATLTSASGFIALLDPKEEDALKDYALKQLDSVVDQFWPEIAGSVGELCVTSLVVAALSTFSSFPTPFVAPISDSPDSLTLRAQLYEREDFASRKLAALVACKVRSADLLPFAVDFLSLNDTQHFNTRWIHIEQSVISIFPSARHPI